MSSKKGQGLSMNVIVIAAIALVVLVVLIMIFSGKMKMFGSATEACSSLGGKCSDQGIAYFEECIEAGSCTCDKEKFGENSIFLRGTECEKTSKICCKTIY